MNQIPLLTIRQSDNQTISIEERLVCSQLVPRVANPPRLTDPFVNTASGEWPHAPEPPVSRALELPLAGLTSTDSLGGRPVERLRGAWVLRGSREVGDLSLTSARPHGRTAASIGPWGAQPLLWCAWRSQERTEQALEGQSLLALASPCWPWASPCRPFRDYWPWGFRDWASGTGPKPVCAEALHQRRLSQHTAALRFLHSRSNLGSCADIEMSISGESDSRISGVACGPCALLSSSMAQSSRHWVTSGEGGSSLVSDS